MIHKILFNNQIRTINNVGNKCSRMCRYLIDHQCHLDAKPRQFINYLAWTPFRLEECIVAQEAYQNIYGRRKK